MQRLASRLACLVVLLFPGAAGAQQARSPQLGLTPPRQERSGAFSGATKRQRADLPPQAPAVERWRYRFQNGHWWYWGKTGRWSYWTGTRWVVYSADSYRRWLDDWRLAQDEAELARLKALIRSQETRPRGRPSWIRDPDSYFPFTNERGGFR